MSYASKSSFLNKVNCDLLFENIKNSTNQLMNEI